MDVESWSKRREEKGLAVGKRSPKALGAVGKKPPAELEGGSVG